MLIAFGGLLSVYGVLRFMTYDLVGYMDVFELLCFALSCGAFNLISVGLQFLAVGAENDATLKKFVIFSFILNCCGFTVTLWVAISALVHDLKPVIC
jgi:hypothetical protein